jgi:zinc protease
MTRTFARIAAAIAVAGPLLAPLGAQRAPAPVPPPPPLTQRLGVDPAIKIATLPNGIRYYIRKNVEPANRAELRLVVNAGSVLEDDDQVGYAHFLEHTAFNGTAHFQKNDLVKYLQSIGVRFGADLNAYTSFDETVYELSVPTDTARLVDTAFLILEDWAHGQSFDSTEVINERGVVLEEWRGRLGAGERMLNAALPIILRDSRYAKRMPIGTQENIQRAQPSMLRKFYQDWYRPDLMAVVAVGDFDVARIETLIKQHFGGIPRATAPRPRTIPAVPNNTAPLVAITTDPEASSSSVSLEIKHPRHTVETVGDYRANLIEGLYFTMLNARLHEIAQRADPPFLSANAGNGSFIGRGVDALGFDATVKDGGIERGVEAVLVEARRVDQFGFLDTELQRAKDNILRGYERANAERDKTNSSDLVGELVRNYLEQEHIPGIAAEYQLVQQLLPTITLKEVNAVASAGITDENRVIWASAPAKPGVVAPTEAQLLAVIDKAAKSTVTAYSESVADEPLIEHMAPSGRVTGTTVIPGAGVTEWRLSNGVRVLAKPTDFKADEIQFQAYSSGGTSLVSDADYMSATFASAIVGASGAGKYNTIDLGKKLAGKAANVSATITQISEGLAGGASPKDIETLFQLIYLKFTAPRLDTAAWLAMKARGEAQLANRGAVPQAAFIDTLTVVMTQHHPRSQPPTPGLFAQINPEHALAFYKDRFANAGDFTFVFVGSFTLDSLKPLVEKYLGALPGTGRVERWRDIGDGPPTTVIETTVRKGTEPQARSAFLFTGPSVYSPQTRFDLLALTILGQMWVTDALREELGGTYSPSLYGNQEREPRMEYQVVVEFGSSPDNVDKLSKRLFAVIDSLKTYGPTEADLVKIKEQILRGRETSLKTNDFWTGNIANRDQAGEDIAGLLGPYDEMVKALTAKQMQDAAKKYFDLSRYVKVVLLPEKKAQ